MARHLITSALPYINGVKHLGNLVGSMLPSDVFARFMRAAGHEVLFICATDEHGTPAELAALAAGQDVQTFCDEAYVLQRNLCEGFGLSFDHFGRTSHPHNHELTNHFARVLAEHGLLTRQTISMVYSPTDGRFLPDRYVTGTCPHCANERARGDQCEACGVLLDPTELINPRSTVSGATNLEVRETTSLFLQQQGMADTIRAWIDTKDFGTLPRSIALKWLDEGLENRDITRDLDWGIPVPKDLPNIGPEGLDHKVWYVWFDAPIGYLGASAEWGDKTGQDWRSWWYGEAAQDVHYTQFMGKDNVAFHAVSFPITILGSQEPWKSVDTLKAFNWLTYYGGKFSTSQGIGVFMDQALELLPADYWRWYLISNAPESDDASFTWDKFAADINADLVGNIGNFVNRIMTFTANKMPGEGQAEGTLVVPTGGTPGADEAALMEAVDAKMNEIAALYESSELRKVTRAIKELWSLGNGYLQDQAPWKTIKEDTERTAVIVRTALSLIPRFMQAAYPIIPTTAERVAQATGVTVTTFNAVDEIAGRVHGGEVWTLPGLLFERIEAEQVQAWTAAFGGGEA